MSLSTSTPSLTEFNPAAVPYQRRALRDIRRNFDYSLGTHEVLLSGSVGSAKSILVAHLAVTHCLAFEKARFCYGRKSMPDLKDTLLAKTLEHMEGDLIEGQHYEHNEQKGKITFENGSEILCRSWGDKKFKKFRSLELSGAAVEELTENNDEDKQAYMELKMRVGRLPHIKENFLISATNPDSPSHWAYNYFILTESQTRHVYYSKTTDNPFLPPQYIRQLQQDLDPRMARRMLDGEWLEISRDVVYYEYLQSRNLKREKYTVNPRFPIHVTFDFNIGVGKPMSCTLFQYIEGTFHFFAEVIIQGARTLDVLEELVERGHLKHETKIIVNGDASGKSSDTRSIKSDYDLIRGFLSKYTRNGKPIDFEIDVPKANPPVRTRHNKLNAHCHNSLGQVRLYVYEAAKKLDEGLRLVALKKGADYIEDDSKDYQHVTTAAGYGICAVLKKLEQDGLAQESMSGTTMRGWK
jgi:PBSX family phage terminase large subunit